ncbi:MAG TPA: tripartite tricarboxylate transporter substrate-binding protein [Candidatus Binatia bacterium]|nr:tripartite tricarboxylate transporter substrate-binding protein [Candidatus Binatia bacterium]
MKTVHFTGIDPSGGRIMTNALLVFLLALGLLPVKLFAAEDFYKGKTIRVIVGGSAGGGFDIYTRAMARHMGKYIPGNPTLIVENMTGAGTFIAAKYVHSSAKPDGLSIGMFNGGLILGRVLGMKGIDIDMRELEFLGVPVQDSTVCALRKESGVASIDQWFASKTPIKLGGLSPGNSTSDVARVLAASLNLPIQLVEGYKGTNEVRLAADSGELHGGCWAWETLRVAWARAIPAGEVNVVLQVTSKKLPDLPTVPLALDLAKTEEARLLMKAGAIDPAAIVRLYVTTPRTPKERLHILRNAFAKTLVDPGFVAEAKKSNLDINPLTGDEVKKLVDDLFNLPPATKSKLASILAAK